MKIVLIGTGNVATVLGRSFLKAGHEVLQVAGRTKDAAATLAGELGTAFTSDFKQLNRDADLYVLAVSDTAIAEVAKQLSLDKKLLVHTAGAVSKDVLNSSSKNYGVLYPLQSLRKELTTIPEIPFLVDGNTEDDCTLLFDFAKTLSDNVRIANDEQRLKLHVAAVVVSNFTNYLYTLAEQFCIKERVDFAMLHPLITAIAGRIREVSPSNTQTGPAVRGDVATIKHHLALLTEHAELREVYAWFSDSIMGKREL